MNYTELFISERDTLIVRKELACLIGLNEAIVLNQIHYWLEKNREKDKNFIDGRIWVFNTYQEWKNDNFPFWSVETVKRTFSKLEKDGILISANYNKMAIDRTKWYSINYEKLQEILKNQRLGQNDTMERSNCHNAKCQNDPTNNHILPKSNKENKKNSVSKSHELLKRVFELTQDISFMKAMEHYLQKYKSVIGKEHPNITDKTLIRFLELCKQYELVSSDLLCDMIDRHFVTDYGIKIDYKFPHFATEDILYYQALNCGFATRDID